MEPKPEKPENNYDSDDELSQALKMSLPTNEISTNTTKTPLNNNKESTKPEYDVNPLFLSHLVEMGFPENRVLKALVLTDNASAESAMNWLLEHGDDPDIDKPLTNKQINSKKSFTSPTANIFSDDYLEQMYRNPSSGNKLVLCVRADLKMSIGKIAAQCSHGTLGIYKRMLQSSPGVLAEWERSGEKKVVVKIDGPEQMEQLERRAIELGLPTHRVRDAGRTQVEPGTSTVFAVAGPEHLVNQVTGKLDLY
jgi:peptidyl-tRNA hydrolase